VPHIIFGAKENYFWRETDRRRKLGRQKLRWLDSTESDLIYNGVSKSRKKAECRSVWTFIPKLSVINYMIASLLCCGIISLSDHY
jgi:hypothetical protein